MLILFMSSISCCVSMMEPNGSKVENATSLERENATSLESEN